jgi:glyoxylase-like metal-dependent hydrolase (beta-lactamase superfamily II)
MFLAALVAALVPAARLRAQAGLDTVQIRAQKLSDHVYVLFGSGGNIGVSVGDEGAFVIDDQFAPLSEKIKAAIAQLDPKPVRFVVNTHWHGDHTGGNENMAQSGAVIVAQDNVRKRMSVEQALERGGQTTRVAASSHAALPVLTFAEDVTFHVNGDSLRVIHVAAAHTDGDAIIYFTKANVMHTGDTFFNGRYPFIDLSTGGSVNGIIAAADKELSLANESTQIVPGHGAVGTKADLQEYRRVVSTIRDRIAKMVAAKKTLAQVAAAKPTAEFDEKWGKGFITADLMVDQVYKSLTKK